MPLRNRDRVGVGMSRSAGIRPPKIVPASAVAYVSQTVLSEIGNERRPGLHRGQPALCDPLFRAAWDLDGLRIPLRLQHDAGRGIPAAWSEHHPPAPGHETRHVTSRIAMTTACGRYVTVTFPVIPAIAWCPLLTKVIVVPIGTATSRGWKR